MSMPTFDMDIKGEQMSVSIFDLFAIGIGPSSSHTMGPMLAANDFAYRLKQGHLLEKTSRVKVELFGSLAWTGKGHHTDRAVLLGLEGYLPESIPPELMDLRTEFIEQNHWLNLYQSKGIPFNPTSDLLFNFKKRLDHHVNGMGCYAFDAFGQVILQEQYYSIGGGFIVSDTELMQEAQSPVDKTVPYPYQNAQTLLDYCLTERLPISEIVYQNERSYFDAKTIEQKLAAIWQTMQSCIQRGCDATGLMPGKLKVKRRASSVLAKLNSQQSEDPMLWLNLYALAVSEENGSGGRVVTAPTNGAAGIIPAVLQYYMRFHQGRFEDVKRFLLTAGGIALLYKLGASISGAEVGCQGEVGVACSMAAGALCEVLGGDVWQVENAAEIGMEHHLGLTCDPIGGLVQIPCIERNAMAAVRAVNAAKLALIEEGRNHISLDHVIATMKKTGEDMHASYKETSLGGLAVVYPEC